MTFTKQKVDCIANTASVLQHPISAELNMDNLLFNFWLGDIVGDT